MTDAAITIEDVSKRYVLGSKRSEGMLSHDLERKLRAPFRRLLGRPEDPFPVVSDGGEREFWALRGVSFDIEPGGVLGLIGSNGAGKSTLLKLLSRITLPTTGRIEMRGRVGTLLEVGTGFHPELTGRENIFLNGAILGMRRREIIAAFDEIVEFAGIPEFLDTPVKRYSSGMYVRLAFAVAAHLQPEILLVDEVLAVGDTEFQRKCIGKMDDVAREGRTVVFVSHNLGSVQRLCDRTVWLDHGKVVADGLTQNVIAEYLKRVAAHQVGAEATVSEDAHRVGTGEAKLLKLAMRDTDGQPMESADLGQPCRFVMTFEVSEPIEDVIVEVGISTAEGSRIVTCLSTDDGHPMLTLAPGTHEISADLEMTLLPGDYSVDVGLSESDKRSYDHLERVLNFSVVNVPHSDEVAQYPWPSSRGFIRVPSRWSLAEIPTQEGLAPLPEREA